MDMGVAPDANDGASEVEDDDAAMPDTDDEHADAEEDDVAAVRREEVADAEARTDDDGFDDESADETCHFCGSVAPPQGLPACTTCQRHHCCGGAAAGEDDVGEGNETLCPMCAVEEKGAAADPRDCEDSVDDD